MEVQVILELGPSFADFLTRLENLINGQLNSTTLSDVVPQATPAVPTAPMQATPAVPAPPAASELPFEEETPAAPAAPTAPVVETPAKVYTAADVRDAMHRCRLRIEGADYETNPDSEGRKLYHKALNTKFKRIAESLGYDKPTLLPAKLIDGFIAQTECIVIENGEVTDKAPF